MLHCKRRLTWNISKNMTYTPYFFRRNRGLGTISVYVGYREVRCLPPICIYMVSIYIVSANYTPNPEGGDNQPTKTPFLGWFST